MNRRTLLTSMAGIAAGSAFVSPDASAGIAGRPTLAIDSDGPERWRIRSWQWRAGAWHPAIARARLTDAGIEWTGVIDAADRAEVLARLRA